MLTDAQVLSESLRIVNRAFVGLLTTVDKDSVPHARWMGTSLAADGLHTIYTLSGKTTRKVQQIRSNPAVCWVYSADDGADVVTLYGHAEVMTSPSVSQAIWDRLVDCAREYVVSALSNDEEAEFVTIETTVSRVEFLSPRQGVLHPRSIELTPSRR
ncbi:MAG: pyridoxamine 5'-phosphate oxidase family protein [Phycisphaeraceae bacterium]|nr:pyridoxamine 5'-phosphate oxidase family protein [Phycisphaeraceae bacterium]